MSRSVDTFEAWIRSTFVELNALEELYFAQEDRSNVDGVGDDVKMQILEQGRVLVRRLGRPPRTRPAMPTDGRPRPPWQGDLAPRYFFSKNTSL
jgi:hypothetical protein